MILDRIGGPALIAMAIAATPPGSVAETEDGKRLYQVHCLACHGEEGRGDGQMKDQLDAPIPDLTTLASRNDGAFPTDEVHQIIDGRLESPSHGSRTMPVWGFTFQSTGRESDQEHAVDQMIDALTRYLEGLQAEAGASTADPNSG